MEQIIDNMIEQAVDYYNDNNTEPDVTYTLIGFVKELIDRMADTINCPRNWRYIGEELAGRFDEDSWVYEQLELWNYVD